MAFGYPSQQASPGMNNMRRPRPSPFQQAGNPALQGLQGALPGGPGATGMRPTVSREVYEADPGLTLPFIAGPGENQEGLDALHSFLRDPQLAKDRLAVDATRESQRKAVLGGFTDPQAEALYGRQQAEREMEIPLRQQEEQSRGLLAQQQEESRGNLGVAREQQRGLESRSQALTELYGMMQPGSRVSIPGAGSISTPRPTVARPPSPALQNRLSQARANLEFAREGNPVAGQLEAAEADFRQALGNIMAGDPAAPGSKEMATQIGLDQELAGLSTSEILAHPRIAQEWATEELTDEDVAELDRLLNYIRGFSGNIQ